MQTIYKSIRVCSEDYRIITEARKNKVRDVSFIYECNNHGSFHCLIACALIMSNRKSECCFLCVISLQKEKIRTIFRLLLEAVKNAAVKRTGLTISIPV